ncbi:hypothetical protein ABRY23_08140 [Melioribacteraceae bacterium 4301-Me]|uniref:hypothetical protein n=1 Tax=Pyranulibacter aquaticus TaxID=3163344 RepID=UPI003595D51D
MKRKNIYYLTPALLAIIVFASNFLSTDLFKAGYQNFSVWFVLSIFSFACGWLINKTLGYVHGGKVVFAVIVASAFISVLLISFFNEYFGVNNLIVENMILYILRNITLGAMAFFGMAICEVIHYRHGFANAQNKNEEYEKTIELAQKEAKIILEDAKLKAEKILYEAQKNLQSIIDAKNEMESRIKELIAAEKDLINKYEKEEE